MGGDYGILLCGRRGQTVKERSAACSLRGRQRSVSGCRKSSG